MVSENFTFNRPRKTLALVQGFGIVITILNVILATQVSFSLKKLLITIGRIQTTIFMGLIYYLVIGPMAVVYQAFGKKRQAGNSYWIEREKIDDWEKYLRRQF